MKIKIDIDHMGFCKVFIDDADISNAVAGIELTSETGQMPEVFLKLHGDVEVNSEKNQVTLEYKHEHKELFQGRGARVKS